MLTLRRWQEQAIHVCLDDIYAGKNGVLQATTGAGKSVFIADLLRRYTASDPLSNVLVTTPTQALVEQLAATLASVLGSDKVGRFYTGAKQADRRVTVACGPSVRKWVEKKGQPTLWVADECHLGESSHYINDDGTAVLNPRHRLGVSATPYLSDPKRTLTLFDHLSFQYTPADALRDGVIVPWSFVPWTGADIDIDDACVEMIRTAVGPGIANAESIADAEAFAERLCREGIPAAAIHSKSADRDALLAGLRDGVYRALVHVDLITTGVDLPWLAWGCFRRDVGSRTRFQQETGRFIRSAPGKTRAIIFDPHNLASQFRIVDEAALGWDEKAPPDPMAVQREEAEAIQRAESPEAVRVAQVAALARWARELYQAVACEGIALPVRKVVGREWRAHPAPNRLVRALRKVDASRLPTGHDAAFRRLLDHDDALTKGIALDIGEAAQALTKRAERFAPAIPVALPPDAAFDLAPPTTLYVAAVCNKVQSAGAIVRGREMLWHVVRAKEPGDSWGLLTGRVIDGAVKKMAAFGATEVVASVPGEVVAAIRRHPRTPIRVVSEKENPAVAMVWRLLGSRGRRKE